MENSEFTCEMCHLLCNSNDHATAVYDHNTASVYYYHAECAEKIQGTTYSHRKIR